MNRVFRIIWSYALKAWVVASELSVRRGKRSGAVDERAALSDDRRDVNLAGAPPTAWPLRLAIMLALTALYVPAHAADRYWDINGNTAGLGGTGAWNTVAGNLFWNSSSTGTGGSPFAWDNSAQDNAFFGGTAGTVTLGGPITAHNLTFLSNGYTLNGGTLTLAGATPTISYAGGNTATINSVLAGTNGLTVNGGSTNGWIVLGGTNTLTGGITVNSNARLVGSGNNSLNGAANVVTVNSGGVLQVNHANAFGGNTAAANLVINNGGNLWLGGISLTHDITAAGGGTININQPFGDLTSTWTGNLVLTADTTLQVTNTGANGNTVFAGNLTDTGANRLSLVLNEGGDVNSSLFLDGTNSFTGGITVNAGQLIMRGTDAAAAAAGNVVTLNGGYLRVEGDAFGGDTDAAQLILNGGVLRVDTNATLNHDVTLNGGTAFIDGLGNATWSGTPVLTASTLLRLGVGGHTLNVRGPLQDTGANVLSVATQGGTVRFNGDLSFSGGLTLANGNTWFDGGSYTYSGDTVISTGTGLVLNSTSLSPNSNIRFEGLNNGNVTIIYGTSAEPTITMPNGAGGGQLRWNGTGGFYALNNQSDVTVNLGGGGATLAWNDGLFVPDGHALILGTNSTGGDARQVDFQNGIDLSGGLREVRVDNGNLTDHARISGALIGTGGLHVLGNGGLELTATNTYSGDTVIGDGVAGVGHLILGSAVARSLNSNIQFNGPNSINNGGVLLLTAASGDFTDALGAGAGQIQWTASGGFGAIGGERRVNLGGAGATLTWGAGNFVPDGEMLRFGGRFANSTVVWENGIDLGAMDRTLNINEGIGLDRDVRLQGAIQGTGSLNLFGQGDVDLFGPSTYSGTTRIGDSSSATDNMWVYFNTFTDIGTASSFGAGPTIELASHNGGIIYTGAGAASGNRNLALAGRTGSLLHLFNRGGGALEISGDIATTISGAQNELRLGGTFVSTDANNDGIAENPNILSGTISDGAGSTSVFGTQCSAGSVWRLSGANTFTGRFLTNGCDFEITSLADAGSASSVGAGSTTYTNFDFANNGTVTYIGDGDSTNRLFRAWNNSTFESSGTGAVHFTNTGYVVDSGGYLHWLGGTNTDDNTLAATLVDASTRVAYTTSNFSLGKRGSGLWALVTDNNADAKAYSSNTRIAGGALRLDNAGAITGGLGVASSHGVTGSSQRSSLIQFEGIADGTGGVLGLTAASGGFFRGTTTATRAWTNNAGTDVGVDPDGVTGPLPAYGLEALDDDNYVQGVRWTGSGGFAAWDGTQVVNLFGDAREVTWGSGGFVPANHQLVFGYQTANGTVDFRNGVNLGAGARTVQVNDGTAARDAIMSGVLRSTSALGGLTKTGAGSLTLTANNTYTGTTNVSAGTLEIGDGGATGSMGSGAQALVAAGATLVANRSNAYTLSQAIIGDGTLEQRGTGITTMTANSDIDHVVLDQGTLVTPATLQTNDVTFTDTGDATLQVTGTLHTAAAGAALVTGGTGSDTIRIDATGAMRANGGLGDGSDTLDVAGTLDTMGGTFDLGAGDDTFLIHDNTNVAGSVLGGLGADTLNANIAITANLDVVQGFETLTKTGAGELHLNGPGNSDFSTVDITAGTLDVDAGAAIVATAGGALNTTVASGATLNVDGAFGCGAGNDSITIAGNVTGNGTIDQCAGDDTLTLQSGSNVDGYTGVFDGGDGIDTVQLDVATTLDFAQGTVANYENLLKSNTGTAILSGAHTYTGGTTISGGTLDVEGSLETPTVAMSDNTVLDVDGMVNAGPVDPTQIIGSAGSNTVTVGAGGVLLASGELGDGVDVLDVAGTLNIGPDGFDLGAGDDTFVVHDGTTVAGTVIGGDGTDILNADIAGAADLGVVQTFETLTKTGAGVLHVNGPGTSDFSTINVNAGTLDVVAGAGIAAAAGGMLDTTVASGATLNVDGAFGCGDSSDTLTVAGTVSGSGTIDQCGGDDTLTINDGASLVQANAISGGAHATGDTVVLNNALAMTLDGSDIANYELLVKNQGGIATLAGTHGFSGGTTLNAGTLDVDGSLATPTLAMADNTVFNVDGTATAGPLPTDAIAITGSAGTNAVNVAAGALLRANGSLGDGNDVLDVAGALDVVGGTFDLGVGDDTFAIHDGTSVLGTVDGGIGNDLLNVDISAANTAALDSLLGFESLGKTGLGTLQINGSAQFIDVDLQAGLLQVNNVTAQNTTVASGSTLQVDGAYNGTTGSDTLIVAGTVTGSGTVALGDGGDSFTLQDGANLLGLAAPVDGGAGVDGIVADIAGSAMLGGTVNFETLGKTNIGTLNIGGASSFDTVVVDGGTLNIGPTGSVAAIAGGSLDTTVAAGATLNVDGSYGCGDGNDTLSVSGTVSGSGTIDLCGGEDTLTLNDGAVLANVISGGTHGVGDTVVLNNAGALSFDASNTTNFEFLQKDNTGEATLTGTQGFSGGTTLNGGVLTVAGVLETPTVALADGTVLNVENALQGNAGGYATIAGSAGVNTVNVAASALLRGDGDLGDGSDVLDVVGVLDTNGGSFNLGAGDDTFTIHDGTLVLGTVDGGAGLDTRIYDINTTAGVGALLNFEGLTKTGTGTLNLTGPGTTELQVVDVLDGTLNVAVGASVTPIPGGSLDTTIAAGATLNVDGSYGCGDGNDTLSVSGTVSGSGTIDLCGGEDTLTLNDGAVLANTISGGTHGTGDTVVLNNAGALSFDASNTTNFEFLQKDNTGEATLTGTQGFSGGTTLNGGVLTVAGVLETPTVVLADGTVLNVENALQGNAGGYAVITGSAGVNTVNVATGALLQAGGDLGDGSDVLDVAGTLDTGGTVFGMGAGDDTFVVHDTTAVLGTVDGGVGNDLLNVDVSTGNLVPLGSMLGFESLGKSGNGTLQINGPSSFIDVDLIAGTLEVSATGSVAAQNTTVASGATLQVDGAYTGTSGDDMMVVAGTVTGSGALGLGDGNDTFMIQDGANLSGLLAPVDGGAGMDAFVADLTGEATLGGAVNFETLSKTNTGTLHVDGPAPSSFTTVNVDGGTLDVGLAGSIGGVAATTIAGDATLHVDGNYQGSAGNDSMEVSGAISGSGLIAFGDGDDTLTLHDGASLTGFTGLLDGGTNGAGDTVVLDNAADLVFGASAVVNFEVLSKQNTGTATLVGNQAYGVRAEVMEGGLVVAGNLATPQVVLADDTALTVDGTLDAGGGNPATITGSAGVNTVTVNGTAIATGDLGGGNDTLDVVGTLDTGGGTFALGDGDDSFVVHDGTLVVGTVDGGAGLDTRVYDINATANLGALVNFEGVTKTGTGTLNINGPGATELQSVDVLGGTLNIGPGGSVVAAAGGTLDTVVGSGATLNVDGNFGCGDGNDTLSVSGTVSGSGTVDLCGGEDTLTLNDGAVLATTISGGGHGSGDTVVLNNANALSFDGGNVVNFEKLQKDNTGEATLTGAQSFAADTTVNGGTLTVAGTLETPTVALADDTVLNVDGTLQGNAGGHAAVTGSAGVNTVNVAADALLQAGGDLGDGNDVLDVAGTLDTGGTVFGLGAGDDTFVVHDTTAMLGTVDGGAGNDMLNVNVGTGNTVPLGSLLGFESLGKSGDGTLQINGASSFIDVDVQAGVLGVTASGSIAAQNTTVASGAVLQLEGAYTGTAGDDTMTVAGTVTGSGTLGLGDGNDSFTIQDGADLSGLLTPVDGGAGTDTFVADLAGEATLGGAINFESLTKTNTGTLHIDGTAPSMFTTVTVDAGTLDVGVDGSLSGVRNAYVAMGATLNVDGQFAGSDDNDVMEVAGTVAGNGTVALGSGDDRLILMEGAAMGGLANAVDGGAGTDEIQAIVETTMVLGPTVSFESLYKGGNGTLVADGDQAYVTTQVEQGTLNVADGSTLSSRDTTIAVGATLDVQGTFTGTDGNDTFVSRGSVNGALSFGAGDDSAHFIGGDLDGLAGIDGGTGIGDVLSFSLQQLEGEDFDIVDGWERIELLGNSGLTLDGTLDIQGATLFIDNTSLWTANEGASLTGSVENAGRIAVGANRVSISGGYTGGNGLLEVTVSPANGTSGGLDIAGNVSGTTGVVFSSDGTEVAEPTSIMVISAPNAAAGAFVPAQLTDGFVRLEGSVYPWTFEQSGVDHNWYLGTDGGGVLPEIPGYAVLPTIGALMAQQGGDLVHQRLASVRGTGLPDCQPSGTTERAGAGVIDDCNGFWVATATNELELGANPGFELSGDDVGLYVGFDQALDHSDRSLRFGGYLGLLHANYWTSGVNSTDLPGVGESEIDMDTPVAGLYFSNQWANGAYADIVLSGQRPRAYVRTADGFNERLVGNSLTMSARIGWRHELQGGWMLEPHMQIDASQVHWQDTVDAGGRALVIDDDLTNTARAGVRVERTFKTAGGTSIRPWATLAVQDTYGEGDTGLEVIGAGANATPQLFPNHDRGLAASLDVGVEAKLSNRLSLFGVVSLGQDLDGTDYEHRAANAGIRMRW